MAGPAGSDDFVDAPLIAVGETSADTDIESYGIVGGSEPPDATELPLDEGGTDYVASAWWKITPDETATIRLDTFGDGSNASLNVYVGGDGVALPSALEVLRVSGPNVNLGQLNADRIDESGALAENGRIVDVFLGEAGVTYYIQYALIDTVGRTDYTLQVSSPDNYVWLLPDSIEEGNGDLSEPVAGVVGAGTAGIAISSNDGGLSYAQLAQSDDSPGGPFGLGQYFDSRFIGTLPPADAQITAIRVVKSLNGGITGDGIYAGSIKITGITETEVPQDKLDWTTFVVPDNPGNAVANMNWDTRLDADLDAVVVAAVLNITHLGWHWYVTHNTVSTADFANLSFLAIRFDIGPPITTTGFNPPLRRYPRTDGMASSSARRLWPPPRSIQHSNRQAGGYL